MALTAEDLQGIKHLLDDAYRRFDRVDSAINDLRDDTAVIKDIVKDHSFRITRLEHHIKPT